jgi:hypothetical protein
MNPELTYNERKEWARLLYTRNDHTISDVALTVNTNEATVLSWINEGSWNAVRRSAMISKAAQIENLYCMIEALQPHAKNGDEPNVKTLEQIMKLIAAVRNLETDESVSNIIEVGELFISWLRRRDTELAKVITHEFERFVQQRMAA